jgi:ubiquinone biosynthesis protein UbiJ
MLTESIENLLNRGLAASPGARSLVAELHGRRLDIEVLGVGLYFTLRSDGASLFLARRGAAAPLPDANPADAHIAGTPLALAQLASDAPEAVIRRGDVRITGDAELAQKFRALALLLRPDVEEELARLIGDTPAHQLFRFARGAVGWGRRAADTTARNVAEYLAHERGDLVPRAEAEVFLEGVDRLREDVDRLEARLERLERSADAR